jgi:biotin carboxylase
MREPEQSDAKPPAFILTGSFPVITRHPLYLRELSNRGLRILVITSAAYRDRALAAQADPDNPASALAQIAFVAGDVSVEGSFVAGAVAHTARWRAAYTIVGAFAVGDVLAEPTGLLCDALGVPSPGLRASRACRSKYLQRWYLPDLSPASLVVPAAERESVDLSAVTYPAVVKPASRHSSWGVGTVRDLPELRERLATYPPHEIVLVEERVVGQEYSVECLVQNRTVLFASATRKETNEGGGRDFVEMAHSVPCPDAEAAKVLLDANSALMKALAFENGIAHSEWRIDQQGEPRLMEVAGRVPGDAILPLYLLATGAPVETSLVDIALGEPASYPAPRRFARQVYLDHEPGVLEDVAVDWPGLAPQWIGASGVWPQIEPGPADDGPTLRAVLVLKERGAALRPIESSDDRSVTFLIDAATPDGLDELERRVRAAVTVRVRG